MRMMKEALLFFTLILPICCMPLAPVVSRKRRSNCCKLPFYTFVPQVGKCMRKIDFKSGFNLPTKKNLPKKDLNIPILYGTGGIYFYKGCFYLYKHYVPIACKING